MTDSPHQKRQAFPRTALMVIVGCAATLALAETGARIASRLSAIERRTTSELAGAIALRPGAGVKSVLVAGNSLLLEGVDFPSLQRGLQPEIESRRLVVEQTAYLDWYYGFHRLFEEGSHPDLIALKLDASQLLENGFRGDYAANRLFTAGDLINVARDADLGPTQVSSLWFAHYSKFYGTRAEIRNWLLGALMPGMRELRPHLARFHQPRITRTAVLREVPSRLARLRQMAVSHGVRLILLVPATLSTGDENIGLIEAAHQADLETLSPIAQGELSPSEFNPDLYHLNAAGAKKYTGALIPLLKHAALEK